MRKYKFEDSIWNENINHSEFMEMVKEYLNYEDVNENWDTLLGYRVGFGDPEEEWTFVPAHIVNCRPDLAFRLARYGLNTNAEYATVELGYPIIGHGIADMHTLDIMEFVYDNEEDEVIDITYDADDLISEEEFWAQFEAETN